MDESSEFGTHQGVKGLEFDRVLAVLDDKSAGGFLFKYEKLFRVEPASTSDIKNEVEGKDSSITRTQRLFYVICSRAKKSLAVVAYTKDKEQFKKFATEILFNDNEIVLL